jgi:hypothetical protein
MEEAKLHLNGMTPINFAESEEGAVIIVMNYIRGCSELAPRIATGYGRTIEKQ